MGLKLVDLQIKDTALKAAWPTRWKNRESNELKWFYQTLPIADNRIWDCNLSKSDVSLRDNSLDVARNILQSWCQAHYKPVLESSEEILSTLIWGNSQIRKRNAPMFDKQLINSSMNQIMTIYNFSKHRFNNLEEVNLEGIDSLYYLGIIAAIPKLWKHLIKQYELTDTIDYQTKKDQIFSTSSCTKHIYWEQIEMKYPITQGWIRTWEKDLNITLDEEQTVNIFVQFRKHVKPTKLQYFQYKLLTRKLTTNLLRSKWDPGILKTCAMCSKEDETIVHILYHCEVVVPLWKLLQKACKYFSGLEVEFDLPTVILNNYKGQQKALINTLLAVLKQHIYAEKCKLKKPNFQGFLTKLTQYYQCDKQLAIENNRWAKLYKKWKNWF